MSDKKTRTVARLFDIRNIVGALMGIYGVILLIAGFVPSSAEAGAGSTQRSTDPIDMSVGSGANLWVGAILLVVALIFIGWAAWRPRS
ncbi:hypothetical protein [Gordonia sp. SL306]|uniref:hypothetical protein n=1 Tax=Gordonia sp. SL306 TaxID=2995145 RepID=UPI00227040FF|nr:hypothetical protein [Gordonia sp. SL306]WAC54529.1 hypothetical protein OVA31_17945 [Gordonia sp. SL306]